MYPIANNFESQAKMMCPHLKSIVRRIGSLRKQVRQVIQRYMETQIIPRIEQRGSVPGRLIESCSTGVGEGSGNELQGGPMGFSGAACGRCLLFLSTQERTNST